MMSKIIIAGVLAAVGLFALSTGANAAIDSAARTVNSAQMSVAAKKEASTSESAGASTQKAKEGVQVAICRFGCL
jgi:hypothetical protein